MRGFTALSAAILKGFVRDRTAVFFAVVFPLMFLVLFGGLFSDQGQSKVELIEVGKVGLVDDLDAGVASCVELGATFPDEQPGETWRVLLDPSGHPFCLTQAANWG